MARGSGASGRHSDPRGDANQRGASGSTGRHHANDSTPRDQQASAIVERLTLERAAQQEQARRDLNID